MANHGEITFDVPNLDSAETEDLRKFADVLEKLKLYACKKAAAQECRGGGYIPEAMRLEARCDAIYKTLPDWARW